MADNSIVQDVTVNGDTIAADEIAAVKYQRIKMIIGSEGVNGGDISSSNPLPVANANTAVSLGLIPGAQVFRRMGVSLNLTSTPLVVGDVEGQTQPFMPLAAGTVEVLSDDANDTVLGSGARTVLIFGLDGNFDEIAESFDLDGTTPVVSSLSHIRVFSMVVDDLGTYRGANEGNITLRESGGAGDDILKISFADTFGQSVALTSHYTIPRNHVLAVHAFSVQATTAKPVTLKSWLGNNDGDIVTAPFKGPQQLIQKFESLTAGESGSFGPPPLLAEMSDIWATARISSGSGGSCSITFSGTLIDLTVATFP